MRVDLGKLTPLTPERQAQIEKEAARIFRRMFDDLSDAARRQFPILVKAGWFPDLEMSPENENEVLRGLQEGKPRKVDRALTEYYDRTLPRIGRSLLEEYPHRSIPLRNAFWAHRRGRYYLSIPVLLAQADGICFEKLGKQLFQKKNNRPAAAEVVEALSNQLLQAFLSPLTDAMPISLCAKERQFVSKNIFNRHAILHGESSAYGTHLNSSRSISLVNYIGVALSFYRD